MQIPKVLVSSENPQALSLTVKGLAVLAVVYLFKQTGTEVGQVEALEFLEVVITAVGALAAVYGGYRKIKNRQS